MSEDEETSDEGFESLQKPDEKAIKAKIEKDQERSENNSRRIETLEKEKDDFKNKWMRSKADYQNLEKQSIQRVSQEILKNKLNLLSEFMTIYEDFIRAENSLSKNNVDTSGIEVIRKNMEKIFSENNITPIDDIVGKPFDPQIHDAVSVVEDDSVDDGTIIQEVAKGYYAEKRILKPVSYTHLTLPTICSV